MDETSKVTKKLATAHKAYMEAIKAFEKTTRISVCENDRIQIRGGNKDLDDKKVEDLAKHLKVEVEFEDSNSYKYRYERKFRFQDVIFLWINNKPEDL